MSNNLLTIIIYTYNSEKEIIDCINSAKILSNEILLVDIKSQDKTIEIAKNLGVTVYNLPHTDYVEPAREFGINKASTNWVFILDADERITPELAQEISSRFNRDEIRKFTHFKVPRKNVSAGKKWLKHGGWWPDYQIRLINKKYFKIWPKEIHSTPQIEGHCGILKQPFLHYFHGDFESMVKKTVVFEDIESDLLFNASKQVTTLTLFRKFFGEIYRRLIKHLGFLDGKIGIIEAIYQASSKTITYLFLYEKKLKSRSL